MILRNIAVRHGRRSLAAPLSRSTLRQLSTDTTAQPISDTPPNAPGQSWPTQQASSTVSRNVASSKKKQKNVQDTIMMLGADSTQEHHGPAWTKSHKIGSSGEELTPAQQFAEFQRIQKNTRSLGSRVEKRYWPTELVRNPPGPQDVTLELLMASQTHMGHNTSLWNPANSRYIFGVRQGIHIISLETTAAHLRRAARVVEEVSYQGGVILFVGTRPGQMEIVTKAAKLAGACHLFTKWTPGSITNRDVLLRSHPTKVVDHLDNELDGFDMFKGTARPLMPDLVVCLNPLENYTLLYECGLKSIPTIGVIDTNVDPSWVTYTIPANDDSLRSVAVIAGVLGRAGGVGQKRRLEEASRGSVPWSTHPQLVRHMKKEVQAAIVKRKEVMGQMQDNVQGFTEEEQNLLRTQYQGDELQVSEEEMMGMMGAAALGESSEPATLNADVAKADAVEKPRPTTETTQARLGDVEERLQRVQLQAAAIEAALLGAGKGL